MGHQAAFKHYLQELTNVHLRGDAREESFYPALRSLIEALAAITGHPDARVTTLPRSTDAGNPDFRVWNGADRITGYIEAKKPGADLDLVQESEQLQRYRATFPNLILTDFLEFRLFRDGRLVEGARLGRPLVLIELGKAPPLEKPDQVVALFDRFLSFSLPKTFTAESLAIELAKRTRLLREVIAHLLAEEEASGGTLTGFLAAFRQYLIGQLSPLDFADLYAQTVTYGLFAARCRAGADFARRYAFDHIPRTIGVLRDLFKFISLGDLPVELEWVIDDIAHVLAVADAPAILHAYYREGRGSDPIVHFYETFLAHYDPEERERRGVYYTPEPVVSFIVRSLHSLLKTEFGLSDGLASREVRLLDPAAGTMTFIAHAAQEAVREFETKYGSGARSEFIRDHILEHFYAFELMMAPYAVGHLKMGFYLEELGHALADNERVRFYLTNTLEMEELDSTRLPGFRSLAEEAHLALEVKRQTPILVILGNPPYSARSVNRGRWIEDQLRPYKDPVRHEERNLMPLSDDYVKFLRFAEWKITQRGCGLVGMISNNGYLDNPTFRGMRKHLIDTFDTIYILNLHGDSKKRERSPDGTKDENVFDIRQGVAIVLFLKFQASGNNTSDVFYADMWGSREEKYARLDSSDVQTTQWLQLKPRDPLYLLVPWSDDNFADYSGFISIPEVFPINSTGIKTHRDHFVFDFDKDVLYRRILTFSNTSLPDDVIRDLFRLPDTRDWNLSASRSKLANECDYQSRLVCCLYRPFDIRWLFYHPDLIEFDRFKVMSHMLAEGNLALVTMRQVALDEAYTHAFVANVLTDNRALMSTRGTTQIVPLYLRDSAAGPDIFTQGQSPERRPNLNPAVVAALAEAHGKEPSPEAIFAYVYAVLYAPTYRQKYAEFLRLDFPRIPFTSDAALFMRMAELGDRLVGLHLLRSAELDPPLARFEGQGDQRVAKTKAPRYEPSTERVYINATQYFVPVPPEVWAYQIGGYQVCHKWLKDRADRQLKVDEVQTYCRIVTALAKTIEIQEAIDEIYPAVEGATISLRQP